ncbi:MAG: hypothetical protein IJ333_06485 [Clostridia bacterium]|nr:hypothetical protein [Clostridia bacterium]
MKKIYSIFLLLTLILSLFACKTQTTEIEEEAFPETPVVKQEWIKQEQASETEQEREQKPAEEMSEQTDVTQRPENPSEENPVEKESEMENHLVCEFFLYCKSTESSSGSIKNPKSAEYPEYVLDDFSNLGINSLKNYSGTARLYGIYTDVKTVEAVVDSLLAREEVRNVEVAYAAYRVEKGIATVSYPSLEREHVDAIDYLTSLNEKTDGVLKRSWLYKGRVYVEFVFDDQAYHHLLTMEDFSNIDAEACSFHCDGNKMFGYVNLTDDSEDTLKQTIATIEKMPNVDVVGRHIYWPYVMPE